MKSSSCPCRAGTLQSWNSAEPNSERGLFVLSTPFPDRFFDAIKCVRNKNPHYKEILAALEVEEAERESALMEAADSSRSQPCEPHPSSGEESG
jgi:hypothetical protein